MEARNISTESLKHHQTKQIGYIFFVFSIAFKKETQTSRKL